MSTTSVSTPTTAPATPNDSTSPPAKGTVPAPSGPFIGASWAAALIGIVGFLFATWHATDLDRTGKFLLATLLLFGLYGIVGVTKAIRDKSESVPVSAMFIGVSWIAALIPILLLGLFIVNSALPDVNQSLFAVAYLLAAFGTVAVQKNIRDLDHKNSLEQLPPPSVVDNAQFTA